MAGTNTSSIRPSWTLTSLPLLRSDLSGAAASDLWSKALPCFHLFPQETILPLDTAEIIRAGSVRGMQPWRPAIGAGGHAAIEAALEPYGHVSGRTCGHPSEAMKKDGAAKRGLL